MLYETHSELDVENDSMVQRALKEINRIAKIQHATLQGKLQSPGQEATVRLLSFVLNLTETIFIHTFIADSQRDK